MKKRKKIIFLGAIFVGILSLAACAQPKEEETVLYETKAVKAVQIPELSDTRKKLEKLYQEREESDWSDAQFYLLIQKYKVPLLIETPEEYSFEDRMDLYLTKLRELAEKKEEYDFLYSNISDDLLRGYQEYKEELSEKDCERFLEIINLCKKRLKTARIWEEPKEEAEEEPGEEQQEENPIQIKLTDTRKKLERISEKRGFYNPRSGRETDFLWDKYHIPCFVDYSEKSFEKRFNRYLDKMEKLAKKQGEYDLLYEDVSDNLIWDYDQYRTKLTEEQCQRMLKLIKLCKKRMKSAKTLYK